MSWSFTATAPTTDERDVANALEEGQNKAEELNPGIFAMPEVREQIEAAKDACGRLVHFGAVGTGRMVFTLSGHANEVHLPKSGWSNDTITVSVYQSPEPSAVIG